MVSVEDRVSERKAAIDAAFAAWWSEAFSHKMNVAFASEGGRERFLEALHTMAKDAWLSGAVAQVQGEVAP